MDVAKMEGMKLPRISSKFEITTIFGSKKDAHSS